MPLSSPRISLDPSAQVSEGLVRPVMAGTVTALVGFTSTFAVVLSGLRAVGANPQQASSGLLALCTVVGIGVVILAWRTRLPVTLAWSTPGAALLAVAADSSAAGGSGPAVLAAAFTVRPRWSVPGALAVALAGIVIQLVVEGRAVPAEGLLPAMVWTAQSWSLGAVAGIALPLYIVTMASQNVPGVAVLGSFGYRAPWRASMLVTGAGTLLAAPFGGHAINLAALSAALAAGEEAGADRGRRWVAGFVSGLAYLLLGAFSAGLAALVAAAPPGVLEAVAGLALLSTLAGSASSALAEPGERTGAVVTFLVAASGLGFLGIGAAFWALLAGLLVRNVLKVRNRAQGNTAG